MIAKANLGPVFRGMPQPQSLPSHLNDMICSATILTMFHHDSQELDNHFWARTNQDLPLAPLLRIADGPQSVGQNIHTHHVCALTTDTTQTLSETVCLFDLWKPKLVSDWGFDTIIDYRMHKSLPMVTQWVRVTLPFLNTKVLHRSFTPNLNPTAKLWCKTLFRIKVDLVLHQLKP